MVGEQSCGCISTTRDADVLHHDLGEVVRILTNPEPCLSSEKATGLQEIDFSVCNIQPWASVGVWRDRLYCSLKAAFCIAIYMYL